MYIYFITISLFYLYEKQKKFMAAESGVQFDLNLII